MVNNFKILSKDEIKQQFHKYYFRKRPVKISLWPENRN